MEFLSNALFSEKDESLLGVMITHFDPKDYLGRAETNLLSTDKFIQEYPKMRPQGFAFEGINNFLSDTVIRREMTSSVYSYVEQECSNFGHKVKDLVDLVLLGVTAGGFVLSGFEDLDNIGVPIYFSSFKVSNSSFNVYSSFKEKGKSSFKTCTLLHLEDGSGKRIYTAFPRETDLSAFGSCIVDVGPCEIEESQYEIYQVTLGLTPYYTSVGEAFLNYLAYSVAYYDIGEKVLKAFSRPAKMEKMSLDYPKEIETEARPRRYSRNNVSIVHTFSDTRLNELYSAISTDNGDEVRKVWNTYPESKISWQWLQDLYGSEWFKKAIETKSEEEAQYISAMNLLPTCRVMRLKFALELLTHRYYISLLGLGCDTLPLVLRGGGVDGESLKRVDIRNY